MEPRLVFQRSASAHSLHGRIVMVLGGMPMARARGGPWRS